MVKEQEVFFDKEKHIYSDKLGNQLISCGSLLSKFKNPFDPDGTIIERYAAKNGLTADEVKAKWAEGNKAACDYGTEVHEELEHYILHKEIRESDHKHYVEQFAEIPFVGRLYSEKMLYCLDNMVAGTADIVELFKGGVISIWDFKTNKELSKRSKWGNKMLHGLEHLDDCNFNHYQLQLSVYGYLCELKGLMVNNLTILYLNPQNKRMEVHKCKYLREEVQHILKVKDSI